MKSIRNTSLHDFDFAKVISFYSFNIVTIIIIRLTVSKFSINNISKWIKVTPKQKRCYQKMLAKYQVWIQQFLKSYIFFSLTEKQIKSAVPGNWKIGLTHKTKLTTYLSPLLISLCICNSEFLEGISKIIILRPTVWFQF